MISFLQNSIQEHDINLYKIHVANNNPISNDAGIHLFDTKLSPALIHSYRNLLANYTSKNYTLHSYQDKTTKLDLVNCLTKVYTREFIRDFFIDTTKNMIVSKIEKKEIPSIYFPNRLNYHEQTNDIEEYLVSDTISLLIKNNSEIVFIIKKDEYIDTTIDCLKLLLERVKCSGDN